MNANHDTACDLLLTNGSVITVDDERRVHEPGAVAIRGDRILAVGTPLSAFYRFWSEWRNAN